MQYIQYRRDAFQSGYNDICHRCQTRKTQIVCKQCFQTFLAEIADIFNQKNASSQCIEYLEMFNIIWDIEKEYVIEGKVPSIFKKL